MRKRNNKQKLSKFYITLVVILFAAVCLSFFGEYYWFFDLFTHFVFQYAALSLILSFIFILKRRYILSFLLVVVFALQIAEMSPLLIKSEINEEAKYDRVKVLQYNVKKNNKNIEEITRWIVEQSEDVDVVVLLEVSNSWKESLRRIKWAYPYHISKDMRGGRNMVVFSRLYVDELEVKYVGEDESPAIVLRGETIGYEIPFVLYGIHPPSPILPSYYQRRNDILVSVAKNIANETAKHKFLVADFNSSRFSPWFEKAARISGLNDSNEGLGLYNLRATWPSFVSKFFGIAIDNMIISDNIKVVKKEFGPSMGSDHFPVTTTLRFMKE